MPESVLSRDRHLLWHPYASLRAGALYSVAGAQGPRVQLSDDAGQTVEVLDGMSSWWSVVHGYRHPVIDAALHARIDDFSHVMFGGLTHEPAVELGERLRALTGYPHVFFADSGSVSVEVALKLAVQYHAAHGRARGTFLSLRGGYHGDTTGAMAVCDPVDGMHQTFAALLPQHLFAPQPPAPQASDQELQEWQAQVRAILTGHEASLAGIIVEPILQGAGGMRPYHPAALRFLATLATEHDALLIADEIATGFGRTGELFAAPAAGVIPDITCVGKALTGGYLTLAAVLCTAHVGEVISESSFKALMHGPTFMANPLACSAANASLSLLTDPASGSPWTHAQTVIAPALDEHLTPATELQCVAEVRVLGGVGVIALDGPVDIPAITSAAVKHGAWVRPFRNLVYTMPPYLCSPDEVAQIAHAMVAAVKDVHEPRVQQLVKT